MELLNGLGEPITPVFNNQLIHLKAPSDPKPGWMRPRLTESQLARLSGSPEPEVPEVVESPPEPLKKTDEKQLEKSEQPPELPQADVKVKDEIEAEPESEPQPTAPEESDAQEPAPPSAEEPSKTESALPTPAEEKQSESQQPAEEETKLMPSSSLGGSARELLNSDGRLRKP